MGDPEENRNHDHFPYLPSLPDLADLVPTLLLLCCFRSELGRFVRSELRRFDPLCQLSNSVLRRKDSAVFEDNWSVVKSDPVSILWNHFGLCPVDDVEGRCMVCSRLCSRSTMWSSPSVRPSRQLELLGPVGIPHP